MLLGPFLLAGSLVGSALAATNPIGFNSGARKDDSSPKKKADFLEEFTTAKSLPGTHGRFTSVKPGTTDEMIPAFSAAVETNTSILAGIWASGIDSIESEIDALKNAVNFLGSEFTNLLIGVSIGSNDLYRNSEDGIKKNENVGSSPENISGFIKDFREAVAGTPLAQVPVGHVEGFKVWKNSSNKAVIDAVDWVGLDDFAYLEDDLDNSVTNAGRLLDASLEATREVVGPKPIWITGVGWPVEGPDPGKAVSSMENAKHFWQEVGCRRLFNKLPTFWSMLRDSNPEKKVKFGIMGTDDKLRFELGCPHGSDSGFDSAVADAGGPDDAAAPREVPGALYAAFGLVIGILAWV